MTHGADIVEQNGRIHMAIIAELCEQCQHALIEILKPTAGKYVAHLVCAHTTSDHYEKVTLYKRPHCRTAILGCNTMPNQWIFFLFMSQTILAVSNCQIQDWLYKTFFTNDLCDTLPLNDFLGRVCLRIWTLAAFDIRAFLSSFGGAGGISACLYFYGKQTNHSLT